MGNSSSSPSDESSDVPLAGVVHELDTHLGKLSVRVLGDIATIRSSSTADTSTATTATNSAVSNDKISSSSGSNVVTAVVCFHGGSASLLHEWLPIADALSKTGKFVIAIPNFHSNPRTKPAFIFGGMQPADLTKLVKESVMQNLLHCEQAVVMGKSWGGFMAALYTAQQPATVQRLVLQAPAWSTAARVAAVAAAKVPLLLCWARDDFLMSYSHTEIWKRGYDEQLLQIFSAEKGGHAVIPEYQQPIIDFLTNSNSNSNSSSCSTI